MSRIVTNSHTSLKSGTRLQGIDLRYVAGFAVLVLVGGAASLYPIFLLICLAAAVAVGIGWAVFRFLGSAGLELWQVLLLTALSGYMLLNYGFENLAFHMGGFPVIISYGLVYAALALALFRGKNLVANALREPAVLCMLALLAFSLLHLVFDLPQYGLMAIRDDSMCLDGLFMLLGLAWAIKKDSVAFISKWLMVIFAVNMLYGLTQPWGEQLWSWSPESGVFIKVPIFGNYNGIGDLEVAGAMFCLCVGAYVIKRPKWLVPLLVMGQFLAFAFAQVRRMYVALVVILIILILLGEAKKFGKLLVLLPVALAGILAVTTLGGIEINGRVGPVKLDFFREHIRSIETPEGTPGSSVEGRFQWADEALGHFYQHPIVGVGFGQPLLSEVADDTNGAVTRQPHNSSLTYLARLGLIGFAMWIAFHFFVIKTFIKVFRQRHSCDKRLYAFVLWVFLFYIIVTISSLVEPTFEYPSFAIPFYFLIGFAVGTIRWHLFSRNNPEPGLVPLATSGAKSYS
jgi:O-antigen ligase